ncbi:MAG TPA: carbohydrate-binding family 9-like protein [Ignavibacteriaceae bacterium]|nr:carbohydrate-binding family 9-like protein [Ignavibacteriaceae bacterium]
MITLQNLKILTVIFIILICNLPAQIKSFPEPQIKFTPKNYICYKTTEEIKVDGKLNESSWKNAPWTDYFVDIQGTSKPSPRFKTRVKMLWDDDYFYFYAQMEEPDVWATLKKRDAVIFHDNDFEIFIDPDGDTHLYYEFEINAFNTPWDLLLIKPYRDGGPPVNSWNILGLKTAVNIEGTINNPDDKDNGWSVEIAMPWSVLRECANKEAPPKDGDQWRINFSRVEWKTKLVNGKYEKLKNPQTSKYLPEDNWVWSPQGLINMHYPEMWGFVQFSEKEDFSPVTFIKNPDEKAKWALRKLYYAEQTYFLNHNSYTNDFSKLNLENIEPGEYSWPPVINVSVDTFEGIINSKDGKKRIIIYQNSRVIVEPINR